MAPSRHDWKIVDWDVKPQHNQPTKAFINVYQCFFDDKNAYFHDIFSIMAVTHSGNFGSMTMFLTPVFCLIMHKILVNIHAFDI